MNDVATFFRDRQKDPGETYQLTFEGWKGTHLVSVYSQRPIESRSLEDQNVPTRQDYDVAVKDLRNAINGSGGGGMIVIANDEERSRTFTVVRVNAKPSAAADRFVALSPGCPPAVLSIDGNNNRGYHKCAAGSYALVPVSDEAQQRLQDFLGYLSWLSPDLESVVLHAIRRPSLDRRLDRVETRLFAQTADEALASSQQGVLGRIKGWMVRSVPPPVVRLATAVLLVLLVAMNGAILYSLYSRSHGDLLSGIARAGLGSKERAVEPFVDEAKTLLDALRKSKDPLLRKVDDGHFPSLATEEQIQKAFAENPALWGLVKLQMLAIDDTPQSEEFLTGPNKVPLTRQAYEAIPQNDIPADARQFLAAVGCRMHPPNPMPFATEDCKTIPADAFEKGLQKLTTFVKGRR